MNGLRWHADLVQGQKTGIYLDQRENYLAAAHYARGNALDCFTSTGGFALHLANRASTSRQSTVPSMRSVRLRRIAT